MLYKMINLSNELSEPSHDELQYVIDGYFLWAYNTMKWKALMGARRRANLSYCKTYPRIMLEKQI